MIPEFHFTLIYYVAFQYSALKYSKNEHSKDICIVPQVNTNTEIDQKICIAFQQQRKR